MKSILLFLSLISCSYAQIPNAVRSSQNGPLGPGTFTTEKPYPASGSRGLLVYNPDTSPPSAHMTVWGSEFEWNTGTPNVINLSSTLLGTINGKQDQIPAGIATEYYRGDKTWATFPTTVSTFTNDSGYITSAALSPYLTSSTASGIYATQSAVASGLSGKFNTPSGTTAQYVRGDGTLATLPAPGVGTVTSVGISSSTLTVTGSPVTGSGTIVANMPNVGTLGTYSGVTTDAQGRVTAGANWTFASGTGQQLSRTIQTVAAAANGWQISSTRNSFVSYSGTINSSSTLAGGAAGVLILEIASTNSAVATDWKEIARTPDGQSNGLIVGLALNQVGGGCVTGIVPAGYYVRVRSANTTGTSTYTYNSGQEIVF